MHIARIKCILSGVINIIEEKQLEFKQIYDFTLDA